MYCYLNAKKQLFQNNLQEWAHLIDRNSYNEFKSTYLKKQN